MCILMKKQISDEKCNKNNDSELNLQHHPIIGSSPSSSRSTENLSIVKLNGISRRRHKRTLHVQAGILSKDNATRINQKQVSRPVSAN